MTLKRTVKSCRSDAPMLASSLREEAQATVSNKPGHRGEREVSRKTIARGMPGETGVTVVTMLVCLFFYHTRGFCNGPRRGNPFLRHPLAAHLRPRAPVALWVRARRAIRIARFLSPGQLLIGFVSMMWAASKSASRAEASPCLLMRPV